MDEVDFTILAATSVLGDLVDVCPPAAACRDAFERMSRATVQMCLGSKQAPTSGMVSSGNSQDAPAPIKQGDRPIVGGNDAMQVQQQYRPFYHTAQSAQSAPAISATQHQLMQRPLSRASSTDAYSHQSHPHRQAEARRTQHAHFDHGFRELFTSPRQPHITPQTSYSPQQHNVYVQSPTTPTEGMQYHPSVYAHAQQQQNMYPQGHSDIMIDPALQQRGYPAPAPNALGDWAYMDMAQLQVPEVEKWEHDSWSDEGNSAQVDLFDGFFFGNSS